MLVKTRQGDGRDMAKAKARQEKEKAEARKG
jgi:hypothetical protein